MTIFDIIVLAILVYGLFSGMHKGFIASFLSLIGYVAAWLVARMYYVPLANVALGNKALMSTLNQYLEAAGSISLGGTSIADVMTNIGGTFETITKEIGSRFNLGILRDAFVGNVQDGVFADQGFTTVGQYLEGTIWTAVFQVLSFVLIFIVACLLVNLIVNLLNHVIRFPVLRGFDALLGGVFGLVRAAAYSILLLVLAEIVVKVFVPTYLPTLESGKIYGFIHSIDLIHIRDWILQIFARL